jgi:hypothetical protein
MIEYGQAIEKSMFCRRSEKKGVQLLMDKTALLITVLIVLGIITVTAIRLYFA